MKLHVKSEKFVKNKRVVLYIRRLQNTQRNEEKRNGVHFF